LEAIPNLEAIPGQNSARVETGERYKSNHALAGQSYTQESRQAINIWGAKKR